MPCSHVGHVFAICRALVLFKRKAVSVFLESTNIRRVKLLMTVNLRFYFFIVSCLKIPNQSTVVDKQVIRIQIH